MSIWQDISAFLSNLATEAFSGVVEAVRTVFEGDAETRKKVSFSVALIALSAKMAKADGVVTQAEVQAFHEIFDVPQEECVHVMRLYNLAKQDVAGFDSYARQVRRLFPGDDPADQDIMRDVIDALFHISKADGVVHENELLFLEDIAVVFGFQQEEFDAIRLRHVAGDGADPYRILGAEPDWEFDKLKSHYRKRVAESHPDKLMARGVPKEFIVIATDRLAALNSAWEAIEKMQRGRRAVAVAGA